MHLVWSFGSLWPHGGDGGYPFGNPPIGVPDPPSNIPSIRPPLFRRFYFEYNATLQDSEPIQFRPFQEKYLGPQLCMTGRARRIIFGQIGTRAIGIGCRDIGRELWGIDKNAMRNVRRRPLSSAPFTPAKAGVQFFSAVTKVDPGFRRDERGGVGSPAPPALENPLVIPDQQRVIASRAASVMTAGVKPPPTLKTPPASSLSRLPALKPSRPSFWRLPHNAARASRSAAQNPIG